MPNPDNAIFLCYRRDDSNPAAYGIYERLKVAFGERGVFLDHYGFRGGEAESLAPILEIFQSLEQTTDDGRTK